MRYGNPLKKKKKMDSCRLKMEDNGNHCCHIRNIDEPITIHIGRFYREALRSISKNIVDGGADINNID